MRIEQTLDPSQGQAALHHRVPALPAVPTRRVQAIGQSPVGEDSTKVAGGPPDDAIRLDLSAEGREAARRAALEDPERRPAGHPDGEDVTPDDVFARPARLTDRELEELSERDRAVRAHAQAVRAAGASLSVGGANYTYQVGPDGRLYVVDGEVSFDTSEVRGDPEATLRKAEQLRRAALAATDASPRDRAVAALAASMAARARQELNQQKTVKGG